jgi:hypothetical protein
MFAAGMARPAPADPAPLNFAAQDATVSAAQAAFHSADRHPRQTPGRDFGALSAFLIGVDRQGITQDVIVCAQTKVHAIRPRSQEGIDALSHHESRCRSTRTHGATQTRAQRQNAVSPSRRARTYEDKPVILFARKRGASGVSGEEVRTSKLR